MDQVARSPVQDHELDRPAETSFELALEPEAEAVEGPRRFRREEDRDVHVAGRRRRSPRDAAEEISGSYVAVLGERRS